MNTPVIEEKDGLPPESKSINPVSPPAPRPFASGFLKLIAVVDRLIDSAAGYDERILTRYGTPTDEKRRRNIGRAILVATVVGSLGWFTKILMSFPGILALPVALIMSALYGVLSYSLESFFAANVNPYATLHSKLFSLLGRVMLSAVIAFSGALPWVTIALKSSVQLEMSKMAIQEQATMRGDINAVYGLSAIEKKAVTFQDESRAWADALVTMPAPIQAALDRAQACDADFAVLKDESGKKDAALNSRLRLLARLESAQNATAVTLKAVATERAQIYRAINKTSQDVQAKKAQCQEQAASAAAARATHMEFATQEGINSDKRLAALRKDESEVDAKVRVERARVDQLITDTSQANSSAEFSALLSIIKTQLYAQVLAGLIFLGLLLVDALPLTLRLFSRPGPYDAEKNADDEIKGMRAEGRLLEARMMHEVRRHEMASKELRDLVQAECRPHIRSVALNGVNAFLRKQVNV